MQNRGTKVSKDPWPPLSGPARGGEIPGSWVGAPRVQKGRSQVLPLPPVVEAPRQPPALCLRSPCRTHGRWALSHPVPSLQTELKE